MARIGGSNGRGDQLCKCKSPQDHQARISCDVGYRSCNSSSFAMPQRSATLLGTLESCPGMSHIIYSYLRRDDLRACRLVCKRVRSVMDGNIKYVTIHLRQASTVEDNIELFARSSIRSTSLSLSRPYGPGSAEVASELSSALSAPSHEPLAALQAVRELHLGILQVPLHLSMHSCFCTAQAGRAAAHQRPDKLEAGHCKVTHTSAVWQVLAIDATCAFLQVDESCLAACTQLTRLECPNSFPGLSQLTQLRRVGMHEINSLSAVTVLASLPHLDHLRLGSWVSPDQLGSSQPFIFPSLTCLEFVSVNASFLAAMGCPKLLHLGINEEYEDGALGLVVDSAPGLRACAEGILQHCSYVHLTRKPGVTLTDVLEALAPWQPSAAALSSSCEGMGLMLDGEKQISASHLELLPTDLQELSFTSSYEVGHGQLRLDVSLAVCLRVSAMLPKAGVGAQAEDLVRCRLGGVREVDAQDPTGPGPKLGPGSRGFVQSVAITVDCSYCLCLQVDESSLAACTQLTRLQCGHSFPGLSQLTQLQHVSLHTINSLSTIMELNTLPYLAHLELGSCVSTDQLGSSQRFLFPSLTFLKVSSINASLLAALDCPQLQRLVFRTGSDACKCLCVDSVPSLYACVGSLLKHCGYVRLKCGPGVTLTNVLEALAPWQPSAAALSSTCEGMGLMLDGEKQINASHLELLPPGLQILSFMGCTLLPDALHPVATRLTQLKILQLQKASKCSEEDLQLLAGHSVQGRMLTVQLDTSYTAEFAASLQCLSDKAGRWSGRPGPRFMVSNH
ncbi:hypothetical protein QJQ45_022790 [Haematococcus lacustris]|nr:hypothetical protein QJQ45_022790 [Haematococcus lacustris]